MSSVFNIKIFLMTPLIKLIIKFPKLMESKVFLKAMIVFPEKISKSYDLKLMNNEINYQAAIFAGLNMIENTPQMILDLCTGTGFAAFMALKRFPNASVTGIDQSASMIKIASGKVKPLDEARINFEFGNAAKLLYENETYDLVITSNAPVYLSEAVRILKPTGNILVTFSFGGDAFANTEYDIKCLLDKNGVTLIKLISIGKGAFILGQKNLTEDRK